ncbi:hypothetical protein MCOR25_001237 [Pyricularia grisea]|nr:hypothetical protein MCOR25_001237 [Pyricularia grisea]
MSTALSTFFYIDHPTFRNAILCWQQFLLHTAVLKEKLPRVHDAPRIMGLAEPFLQPACGNQESLIEIQHYRMFGRNGSYRAWM